MKTKKNRLRLLILVAFAIALPFAFASWLQTSLQPIEIAASTIKFHPSAVKIAEIDNFKQVGDDVYEVSIKNFTRPLWLCIQPDTYSKPSNLKCNRGELIAKPIEKIRFSMKNGAILLLFSDFEQSVLHDATLLRRLADGNWQLSEIATRCGVLEQRGDDFFIKNQRLLSAPGWNDLPQLVNSDVCVHGEQYRKTFRVYFVE